MGPNRKHSKAFSHRILIFRGSFQWSYEMKVVGLQWKRFHCKTQNHLKTILLAIFLQSQAVTRLTRIASSLLFTGSSISVCSHVFFFNPLIFNWSHHIHRETVETSYELPTMYSIQRFITSELTGTCNGLDNVFLSWIMYLLLQK